MLTSAFAAVLAAAINGAAGLGRAARARKKSAPGVVAAPPTGDAAAADVHIGETIPWRPDRRPAGDTSLPTAVTLSIAERKAHVYIIGGTGSGKSVFITNLFDADVEAGRAVVVVDLRGDLTDKALTRLAGRYTPEQLRDRLVLLDLRERAPHQPPGGDTHCVGFNPLAEAGADAYGSAFFTLDALTAQFETGVQTAELLRNCLLALALADKPGTLLDIEPLLHSPEFRARALASVKDESVRRFMLERLPTLLETPQYAASLLNRLSPYTSVPAQRRCLGMKRGGVSFRKLLAGGGPPPIVLIALGGDTSLAGARLIGSLIIAAVSKSCMSADRTLDARKRMVSLLLDEFENFEAASETLIEIISEGRRFGLGLTCAHQSTAQLSPKLRSVIRNTVCCQVIFSCGGGDADALAGELPSEQPKAALRNLIVSQPVGNALLLRRGKPLTKILARYAPDPDVPPEKVAELRRAALERWGRPKTEVDAEIMVGPTSSTLDNPVGGGGGNDGDGDGSGGTPRPEAHETHIVVREVGDDVPRKRGRRGGKGA